MGPTREPTLLQMAVVTVVAVVAGILTFVEILGWGVTASHTNSGDARVPQCLVAAVCSGLAFLFTVIAGFRRLTAARLWFVLASVCGSLAFGVVFLFRESREWDLASVVLTGLIVAPLAASAWWSIARADWRLI
jgi:hypothetical protein